MAAGVTNREAVIAAQVLLARDQKDLRPDGWWGTFTQGAYDRASLSTRKLVDSLLKTSNATAASLFAETRRVRQAESTSGVVSDDYKMSLALRGDEGASMFNKLPSNARKLAERAYAQGITGVSLVNFLANVQVESKFVPQREIMYRTPSIAQKKIGAMAKMPISRVQELIASGREVFFEAAYGAHTPVGKDQLGNTQPGDGGKYYGRGLKQTTGRYNYQQVSDALPQYNIMQNPEVLVTNWEASADAAIWFWKRNVVRKGKDKDIVSASIAVNGGTNGLAERVAAARDLNRALA